jgi:hypothetical protein
MIGVREGLGAFQSLSTIKNGTSPFNFLLKEPFSSFYDKAFKENLIRPRGKTYNPCLEDCGGNVLLKGIISRTFNYVEQNGYLKILIERVRGNGERGRVVSCLPITFDD